MAKTPSTTKLISEALGTSDRVEQLKRIENLVQIAQQPGVSVMVQYSRGKVKLAVLTDLGNLTPTDVKFILQLGIDEITEQEVIQSLKQQQGGAQLLDEPDEISG